MKVVALKIKDENKNIYFIQEACFKKDQGILGDCHAKGGDRQVSILDMELRKKLDLGDLKGFCSIKFHENITIDGLELDSLSIGDRLNIGDAIIQITEKGKKCFKECKLYKEKGSCQLSVNVIFGKVIESGIVTLDDKTIPLG